MRDTNGVIRFRANPLVQFILDHGNIDMNRLAIEATQNKWSDADQAQFAQLIGYSVSGWGSLSYVTPEQAETADDAANTFSKNLGPTP